MDVEQRIFDEYEKQGHALRSLKEAADIDSAVSAVQRSQFFKESPEEGKRLIQSMLHPRKTQSVFVNPEAVLGLPEAEVSKLGIKNMSESLVSGAPVEIPTADFLTTPSAPQMSRDTAAAADLLTPREATPLAERSDTAAELSRLLAERQQAITEGASRERLREIEIRMREAANRAPVRPPDTRGRGIEGGPSEWAGEPGAPAAAQAVPARPPELGVRGKLSKERLSAWADSELEGRTIGSLDGLQALHKSNATAAERRATELQEQATGGLGRSTRKAQAGISAGVEGAQIGQEGARGALTGEVSPGATLNLIDRSQKWERKAEDKGVAAVKEEVKAGDKIAN